MLENLNARIAAGDEQAIAQEKYLKKIYFLVQAAVKNQTQFRPAIESVRMAQKIAEEAWLAVQAEKPIPAIACKKGCAWCCYLHVLVTDVEVIRIAEYLRGRYPKDVVQAIAQRAKETGDMISTLEPEERLAAKIPCSLLGPDNTCMAYEARPLGCRGFNSTDAGACEKSHGQEDGEVPNVVEKVAVFQSAAEGLAIGTGEQEEVELNARLAELLED